MPSTTRPPAAKPKPQPATDLKRRRNQDAASKAAIEADRLEQIVRLRSARVGWREISQQVGLSHERCRQIMLAEMAARARTAGEHLDAYREEVAASVDLVLRTALRDMVAADDADSRAKASNVALRALRQLSDLYGLSALDGIAEREVRLAEEQGALVAHIVRQSIDQLTLPADKKAEARKQAAAHLRLIASGE